MLNPSEDAHKEGVSIFGTDEHLRQLLPFWRGVAEGGRELIRGVDRRCGQDHVEGEITLSAGTA